MNLYKLSKLGRGLIFISLFTPLLIIPYTVREYVFARNLIFYGLSSLLILLSATYFFKNKQNIFFHANRLLWAMAAFIIIKFLSGLIGYDAHNSFFGSEFRMDGNLGYLMLFGWFLSALIFLDGKDKWRAAFKVSVAAALIASVYAIIQVFFPANNSFIAGKAASASFFEYRLIGPLGNPIFFAGYILPHVFLCLYLFLTEERKKYKYFWLGSSFFLTLIVFQTGTRGAIVSAGITFFIAAAFAAVHFLKNNKRLLKKLFAIGAVFLAIVALVARFSVWARILGIFSFAGTGATRLIFWKIGFFGFLDKWFVGWGPENYSYIFSKFYDPMLLKFSFYETWADKPHNQFIEILSTTGILGFLAFAAIAVIFLLSVWRLMRAEKSNYLPYLAIGAAFISYLGHVFFSFDTLEPRLLIFLLFGFIIFSENNIFKPGKSGFGFLKMSFLVLFLVAIYSASAIGLGTFRAAYYINRANMAIIYNKYSETVFYFKKLESVKTPYANNNWEYLSDAVLKADAAGVLPRATVINVLPIVIGGLEKAASGNANNFSYHFRLGQMYNLAGTYINANYLDKSVEELMKAKNISPQRQVTDLTLAQVYYAKRDVAAGIKVLEDLVAANENISPQPYWYLGMFYDAAGEYDKSYAYMSAAVEKGRAFISQSERILYVTVLGRQKDYEKMAPVYEEIIRYDKSNPRWWANLASIYFELKRYDDARNAARQAIFLDPAFGDEGENFLKKIDSIQYGG